MCASARMCVWGGGGWGGAAETIRDARETER